MANNPGAKKAIRKIERRTEVNRSRRSRVRTFLRKFDEAVASGDTAAAGEGVHDGPIGADARGGQGCRSSEHGFAQGVAFAPSTEEAVRGVGL